MDYCVEAIYEGGVFKPLAEVALPDHLHVTLRIERQKDAVGEAPEVVARQKNAMETLDGELEHVPDNSPTDDLSSDTHEQILYGGQS